MRRQTCCGYWQDASGSREGGSRQDALASEEAAGYSASGEDLHALAAYRNAKKHGAGKKKEDGSPNAVGMKREGAGGH